MSLYMIQMQPDIMKLMRWANNQSVLPRDADDDLGYALHALFAANFGELAPKPFMLQRNPGRPPVILAYSACDAAALRSCALEFALPDAIAAIGLDTLASKPMPEQFSAGRSLGFSVRVRPVVRTDRDGDRSLTRERDAFLAAVDGMPDDAGINRSDVYRDWLTARFAEGGCSIHSPVSLSAFCLTPVYRRGQNRRLVRLPGPDATFSGSLTVAEPDKFSALLARGVGRHRAFGFGMLMLRPA